MGRPTKYSTERLLEAYNHATNWSEFLLDLGIENSHSYNFHRFKKRLLAQGVDLSKFRHRSIFTEEQFVKSAKRAKSKEDLARRLGLKNHYSTKFEKLMKKHKVVFRYKSLEINDL